MSYKNKINILQLLTGLGMGGAEKVVLDLAHNINKIEFTVFVVSLSKREELFNEFLSKKINTTILRKSNSFLDFFSLIQSVNQFVKKNNINIIHAHMTHSIIIASIVKIFNPKIKIIYTSHTSNISSKVRKILIFILKPLRDIDIVFSKNILEFFYKKQYQVVPNGVHIEKYQQLMKKNEKFTFLAIGRLETVKNHSSIIKIVNNLKNQYDFQLHIVGEGYLRDELSLLIKKGNLQNHVKLLGLKNNISELLNKSHCLLMPSLWEGLPLVVLEAGASKLPMIVTPVGSIPSVLNNQNSYLCEIEHFQDKMIEVINNYDEAKRRANKLYEQVKEKHSIESVVKSHEKIYNGFRF